MGCNSSKQNDIQRDRERVARSAEVSIDQKKVKTEAVGMKNDVQPSEAEQIYGKSWTEDHIAEQDFLRNIIEKTQADFIDVTQDTSLLDDKEMEERISRYSKQMEENRNDLDTNALDRLMKNLSLPEGQLSVEEVENQLKTLNAGEGADSSFIKETQNLHRLLVSQLEKTVEINPAGTENLLVPLNDFSVDLE